jgi:hypothetical protein
MLKFIGLEQWVVSKFEKHLNGGSSIIKIMCPFKIHPSYEDGIILMRKNNSKLKGACNVLKDV